VPSDSVAKLVEDVAAGAGYAVHVALLATPGQEFKLERLAPSHACHCTLALVEFDGEHDYLHVLVNYPPRVPVSSLVNSRWRSDRRHSPIHRATASNAPKDGFAGHAILHRPEGRGLPR
jgi:REP element-mobilizing transposase RayT